MQRGADQPIAVGDLVEQDWSAVRAIYLEGIASGDATFETSAPYWGTWHSGHLQSCRLVARSGSDILGWSGEALLSAYNRSPDSALTEIRRASALPEF
jgi:hypothetical protein